MRKKNLLILSATFAVILLIAMLSLVITHHPSSLPETEADAAGYVYIKAAGQGKWFLLPEEESSMQLKRADDAGKEIRNVITLTPEGVYMKESTCDNQDCVMQGLITLENKESRILKNAILCLPNDVIIELYSAEEVEEMENEQNE